MTNRFQNSGVIKPANINISFYLLTPKAKTNTQVYVSVSIKKQSKTERLRFATGVSFTTAYCNDRNGKKGKKELLRKNTTFYLEYKNKLDKIKEDIEVCAIGLEKSGRALNLEDIKNEYYIKRGLQEKTELSLASAFNAWKNANLMEWKQGTLTKVNSFYEHLEKFQQTDIFKEKFDKNKIDLNAINEDVWLSLRNDYFVTHCKFNNSTTNKYLSFFKQFIRHCKRKELITSGVDMDDWKYLNEVEPYKIALKLDEVEAFINLDLKGNKTLEKIRDLFYLEIATGQRYSDLPKLLNKDNITKDSIIINQQKGNERVVIPLYPALRKHVKEIFERYPDGLPEPVNQVFNRDVKKIFKMLGLDRVHTWIELRGNERIEKKEFRYNLVTSHTGRRTFITLARKQKIEDKEIMKISGHRKYEQFLEYCKVDEEDFDTSFKDFLQ